MNSYEQWDYSGENVVFRVQMQDYNKTYVQSEKLSNTLSSYFAASQATTSSLVDVRPETPIKNFPSVLALTMSL